MNFIGSIKSILNKAVADCFPGSGTAFDCQVTPCQDRKFGDYQSNLAFLLAKREKTSPRNIALAVVESVQAQMALPGPGGRGQVSNRSPGAARRRPVPGSGRRRARPREGAPRACPPERAPANLSGGGGAAEPVPGRGAPQTRPREGAPQTCPWEGAPRACPRERALQTCPGEGAPQTRPREGAPQTCPWEGAPRACPRERALQTCPGEGAPQTRPREGAPQTCPWEGAQRASPGGGAARPVPGRGRRRACPSGAGAARLVRGRGRRRACPREGAPQSLSLGGGAADLSSGGGAADLSSGGGAASLSAGGGAGAVTAGALIGSIEVAGAGFINIRIRDAALIAELERTLADPRCGVARSAHPLRIVVDYSSPNLAKDLHVGTMRSTVIGDSIARVLEFLGHEVLRQNHYGDWGANFGVLVAMIKQEYGTGLEQLQDAPLEAVEQLYANGSLLKKDSEEFASLAAAEVNNLQSGNPESVAVWKVLMDKTLRNCHGLYRSFNVSLDASHDCPESFYRDDLPGVVRELSDKGLLVDDDNARCAYLDGFLNVDGDPLPVIVQKSDEGYNYSTTELAGIRHRVERLRAQQIIVVTDRGQELHFRMIRALAQKAGWLPDSVQLRHLGYGVILQEVEEGGRSKKVRFRTRDGGTVKIRDLLAEGRRRSERLTLERNPDIGGEELDGIAAKLTIAALKYADLKQRPVSDYTFNWDQMLASQGNTGVYILYCYVRIASLFGKSGLDKDALAQSAVPGPGLQRTGAGLTPESAQHVPAQAGSGGASPVFLSHELERELLLQLVSFPELFAGYEEELSSHDICHYLYELATLYSRFWKDCPILTAPEGVRHTRLVLSLAVAERVKLGLSLLGIDVVEKM